MKLDFLGESLRGHRCLVQHEELLRIHAQVDASLLGALFSKLCEFLSGHSDPLSVLLPVLLAVESDSLLHQLLLALPELCVHTLLNRVSHLNESVYVEVTGDLPGEAGFVLVQGLVELVFGPQFHF